MRKKFYTSDAKKKKPPVVKTKQKPASGSAPAPSFNAANVLHGTVGNAAVEEMVNSGQLSVALLSARGNIDQNTGADLLFRALAGDISGDE
ncbi:MAG: hypothetical protein JXR70_05870, partial [Spirochaetales bacterium]|nr:hypothetical protein [Spirochaetales bacterium]